jgi:Family of unknown function (DUF6338)
MPDWTQDRLLLFLLFFVPGFISIKIYDLLVPSERRDFQSTLAEAIGYSAVNFAVLLPIVATIYGYGMLERMWAQLAAAYLILLAAPLVWPLLFVLVIRPRFANVFVNPVPKPWDVVFRDLGESSIIIHTSDGRRIGGRYARGSQASSYPADDASPKSRTYTYTPTHGFADPNNPPQGGSGVPPKPGITPSSPQTRPEEPSPQDR